MRESGRPLAGGVRPALLAVAILAALILPAAPAQAAPTTIATFGQGAGRVNGPSGTAVDPNPASPDYRDLYVADTSNRRIDKFDPAGNFLLAWGFGVADGKSHELQTCGPAAEPPSVRCFAGTGNFASASGAVLPGSLVVDPASGDVFVSDATYKRVSKFTPQGDFLLAFGTGVASGGAEGSGNLEAGSTEVKGVTLTEKSFLAGQILTGPGIPPGTEITGVNAFSDKIGLSKPATETATGAALTAAEDPGNVPTDEQQLITLDPGATSGNFKLSFAPPLGPAQSTANIPFNASPGEVQAALAALSSIGAGNVTVGSPNPGGGAGPGGPYTVEFGGERYADTDLDQLQIEPGEPNLNKSAASKAQTTRQGASAAEVCTSDCVAGGEGSGPGQLSAPRSLAFDPTGDLWVGDTNRLVGFELDGTPAGEIAVPGVGNVGSLAIDSAGDFYLLGPAAAGVRKLEAGTGTPLETIDVAGNPKTLTLDSTGNLYLGECGGVGLGCASPYRFRVFGPGAEVVSQFGAGQVLGHPGATGNDLSNALALDEASGTLYVASSVSVADNASPAEKAQVAVQAFPAPEPGPLPEDQRAEDVLPESATLAASLNPEGHQSTYRFQYGTEESYGQETTTQTLSGTGFESEAVKAPLTGLIPETTYHFRLLATNHCNPAEPAEECTVEGPDTTFTTRPAVAIEAQWASEVSARSATVHAELDPLGVAGQRWLEYGTSPCNEGGCAKLGEGDLPASFGAIGVSAALTGLEPATTYHYRFAATDERAGQTYLVHGADRTFATQPLGLGFELADNRAWEMVSPPRKFGASIEGFQDGLVQAAASGDSLAYLSRGSIEESPEGNRSPEDSSVLARRGTNGAWASEDITQPHRTVTPFAAGFGLEYKMFAPELETALFAQRDTAPLSPEASERTPYLRQNTSPPGYTPLLTPLNALPGFGGDPSKEGVEKFGAASIQGASADLAHVVLRSVGPLIAGAAEGSLYAWEAGHLVEASVLPEGEDAIQANLGSAAASVRHAISEDGSRVFWSSVSGDALYVRDTERGETVRLDAVQGGPGTGKAEPLFQGANAAGTVALFTDNQNLTADASEEGRDLYRCEVVLEGGELGCDLTDLSATGKIESAEVQGLLAGMSEDGSRAYFVARGVLDEGPNGFGEVAVSGQPNLYAWREGQGVRYVATLAAQDGHDWGFTGPVDPLTAAGVSAAVSRSGRYLAFMSRRPLSGYDNRDASSGEPAQEVFRYDAASEELTCASCNPSGARPAALRPGPGGILAKEFDPQHLWDGVAVAAVLPEATKVEAYVSLYRPRAVQDDGRVFFNAADSLVPADSNGNGDVYEYEPIGAGSCSAGSGDAGTARAPGGCVSLISSGTAEGTAAFIDASESGDDVFFYSPAQLSVNDEDRVTDVYDARTDGTAARREGTAECQGEACQPPATAPPTPTPASAAFRGPGNLREAPVGAGRCPQGKRQVKRKGKAGCVRRAHGHRKNHRTGRTSR